MTAGPFDEMRVDHIRFYVADMAAALNWLVDGYGFAIYSALQAADHRTAGLGKNQIRLLVTQPRASHHPGTGYLARHGDGVADIALRVSDAAAAFQAAVERGARPVSAPDASPDGIVTAAVLGFGDVVHTFVQRPAGADERALPGMTPVSPAAGPARETGLREVDHFAVCVDDGTMAETVAYYQRVLDFEEIFTERITIGPQAITTTVVQSRSGAVTLTLIEPDSTLEPGHVADFLASHGGAGVQHIAFAADDIVRAIGLTEFRGVEFLSTPDAYYSLLEGRLDLVRYSVAELREHNVLVDEDHYGQLFQIFARSVHPRETFFFEIIERVGARTFGSGNIKALYEAVELQRAAQITEKAA